VRKDWKKIAFLYLEKIVFLVISTKPKIQVILYKFLTLNFRLVDKSNATVPGDSVFLNKTDCLICHRRQI
jgi:hypothetical protein